MGVEGDLHLDDRRGGSQGVSILALVLLVFFFLLTFVGRTLLQLRRTGDAGYRRLWSEPGSLAWWGGVLVLVALLAAPAAPLLDLAGAVPVLLHLGRWVRALGLGLMVVGTAVVVSAQLQMGSSWRVGIDETETTDLVTHGLYRYARNPIYTGILVAFAGLALAVPNVASVIALAFALLGLEASVRLVEEPHLRRLHGARYAHYAREVGRFVPRLGRTA
jgi:protein-S-isoprenylcysteine O-methyltransferase Ste14